MYLHPHFTTDDHDQVLAFMRAHAFVTLIGYDGRQPVATQVPVLICEEGDRLLLRGHIMRKTDHYNALLLHPEALVLFNGPHCYISASWYAARGRASTWNYMTVQATGTLAFMDEAFTLQLLKDLTQHYEADKASPELVAHMDLEEYVLPMLPAIAGFELEVEQLHPVFKLSQNQDAVSHARIVHELEQSGDDPSRQIAAAMRQTGIRS